MMITYLLSLLLLVRGEESCSSGHATQSCSSGDASATNATNDTVSYVPYWGDVYTGKMYSGYLPINEACNSAMFYWMLEKQGGSKEGPSGTPVLLWLNGGPGASSIDGLLMENIGPYQIVGNNTFTYNEDAWTDKYNVLIIDNPVGTGYSYTDNRTECYCSTELCVAKDFYAGLLTFFTELHTEYRKNPFYLVGESYAGKYIPHIAVYLDSKNFKFEGVILGNGLYFPEKQYLTVPEIALSYGILNPTTYAAMHQKAQICSQLIKDMKWSKAAEKCEEMVGTIYDDIGGGVFRYDLRYYNDPTPESSMISYLNSAEVQLALHTTGHVWTDSDETGPVADALKEDFCKSVIPELVTLLRAGYTVHLYNGQMDGSSCNNIGNSKILYDLKHWGEDVEFEIEKQELWRLDTLNALGFRRVHQNLAYVTIANAGHLVPLTQPRNFRIFLDYAVAGKLAKSKK